MRDWKELSPWEQRKIKDICMDVLLRSAGARQIVVGADTEYIKGILIDNNVNPDTMEMV